MRTLRWPHTSGGLRRSWKLKRGVVLVRARLGHWVGSAKCLPVLGRLQAECEPGVGATVVTVAERGLGWVGSRLGV